MLDTSIIFFLPLPSFSPSVQPLMVVIRSKQSTTLLPSN